MREQWMDRIRCLAQKQRKEPPNHLLADIKQAMAERGISDNGEKTQTRVAHLSPRWAAAAALLIMLAGITTYFFHKSSSTPGGVTGMQDIASQARTLVQNRNALSETTTNTYNHPATHFGSKPVLAQALSIHEESDRLLVSNVDKVGNLENEESTHRSHGAVSQSGNNGQPDQATKDHPQTKESPQRNMGNKNRLGEDSPFGKSNNPRHKQSLSVGVYYGGGNAGNLTSTQSGNIALANDGTDFSHVLPQEYINVKALEEEKAKHHHPFRIGVSLLIPLDQRWSLHTGLNYSYLKSDFVTTGNKVEQKLHYIGIPLNMAYQIWQSHGLRVYVSAGGQIEKLVKGTLSNDQEVKEHRPVLSTHASFGGELNLSNDLGLYLEPGISYYIKNGSNLKSSYTEHPFNWNLNIGLRFSLGSAQ